MKESIIIETRVTMVLTRLGIENSFAYVQRGLWHLKKCISSIIVSKFCTIIRKHLKPLVILNLIRNKIKKSKLILKACMKFFTF